jgi:hypothetical protein
MDLCRFSHGNGTRTGIKGMKVAFHTCRVYEEVSIGPAYEDQSVRVGDQAAAGSAMIGLGTIPTSFFKGRMKIEHLRIQAKGVSDIKNITISLRMSNEARGRLLSKKNTFYRFSVAWSNGLKLRLFLRKPPF